MGGISPHKVVKDKSFGSPGYYSTKARFAENIKYEGEPYVVHKQILRNAHVGRQMTTNFTNVVFGKIVATSEPFNDKSTSKGDAARKLGFSRGSALNRDDISNIYDVLRYRQQLDQEIKTLARGAAERRGSLTELALDSTGDAAAAGMEDTRTGADSTGGMSATFSPSRNTGNALSNTNNKMGISLKSRMPNLEHGYDKQVFVPEFVPKVEREVRYARDYGPYRTTMHDIGDGCSDPANIKAPENAKQNFTAKLREIPHLNTVSSLARFV